MTVTYSLTLTTLLLLSTLLLQTTHSNPTEPTLLSLHGSGTTNPSKCLWLLMSQFMERSKPLTQLTYRAVGSSTGIAEFLGSTNSHVPLTDFGAGDVPVSTEQYNSLTSTFDTTNTKMGMVHLPFLVGAVSFFHNIPNVPEGPSGLNVTACLLAKILSREIVVWDHEEILEWNPHLETLLPYREYPIWVGRRGHGSSSTTSITQYLYKECNSSWPLSKVGNSIEWHEDTHVCEGSSGMTNCIKSNPGAIGYLDAGHGWEEGLVEIELKNADGRLLSSKEANRNGGIAAAVNADELPTSAELDFGVVDVLNQPGEYAWPIVSLSYIYVRTNLKEYISNPDTRGLLKLFLKSLFQDKYIDQCTQFGFALPNHITQTLSLNGIDLIDFSSETPWRFETDTDPYLGQGAYVISSKRRTYSEYERSRHESALTKMQVTFKALVEENDQIRVEIEGLPKFTSVESTRLNAALGLGGVAFTLCAVGLGGVILMSVKKCC